MKLALAQINHYPADLENNFHKITAICEQTADQVEIIVFPALSTYSIYDDPCFKTRYNAALNKFITRVSQLETVIVIGGIQYSSSSYKNVLYVINACSTTNRVLVLDPEKVYEVVSINNKQVVIAFSDIVDIQDFNTRHLTIICNATRYISNDYSVTTDKIKNNTRLADVVYVNQVGGQEEIVFCGGSFYKQNKGIVQMPYWKEQLYIIRQEVLTSTALLPDTRAMDYQALVTGLRDYVITNNFSEIILGISGGIDSALTAVLAVDALGAEKVHGIFLPSRYTSRASKRDVLQLARNLKIKYRELPIDELFDRVKDLFLTNARSKTLENLQARLRGVLLMAMSNEHNYLLLTTGNKSELATGYCTLYGDTCGGFAPLKDVHKTRVYELSKWRNNNLPLSGLQNTALIPLNIITREPSAELAYNQIDRDTLPPYEQLDKILHLLLEERLSIVQIIARGFAVDIVNKVYSMLCQSEYKRRQSALGTSLSRSTFGAHIRYTMRSS